MFWCLHESSSASLKVSFTEGRLARSLIWWKKRSSAMIRRKRGSEGDRVCKHQGSFKWLRRIKLLTLKQMPYSFFFFSRKWTPLYFCWGITSTNFDQVKHLLLNFPINSVSKLHSLNPDCSWLAASIWHSAIVKGLANLSKGDAAVRHLEILLRPIDCPS